jgi:hypothetical protein
MTNLRISERRAARAAAAWRLWMLDVGTFVPVPRDVWFEARREYQALLNRTIKAQIQTMVRDRLAAPNQIAATTSTKTGTP